MTRRARDEGGAAAVEFALVGSLFVILMVAILQFGWALYILNDLGHAADASARLAMIKSDAPDGDLQARARANLGRYDQDSVAVNVGLDESGAVDVRTIDVQYPLRLSIPGLPIDVLTLSVSRRVPVL